ncbi:hypothetical protein BA062_29825 [Prauserella flavalba]|uniref:Uncharacterized protein n=1 Tax=Prauserella flavalba TaxID=1477506 RepID=A0A318LI61_9PSEU|nr:hypothetical protein [Prauserella flavalba]PXY24412.1 hypothetical protein BA062_29825 [Prauserella flavalba]
MTECQLERLVQPAEAERAGLGVAEPGEAGKVAATEQLRCFGLDRRPPLLIAQAAGDETRPQ